MSVDERVKVGLRVAPIEYLGMERICPSCGRNSYAAVVSTTAQSKHGEAIRITALRYCPGCLEPSNVSRLTHDERLEVARAISKPQVSLRKLRHHLVWRQNRKVESLKRVRV